MGSNQPYRSKTGLRTTSKLSFHSFDHIFDHLLGITKDHHGLVHVEEFVVQACIARGHGALVHNHRGSLIGLQDRHAVAWGLLSSVGLSLADITPSPRRVARHFEVAYL